MIRTFEGVWLFISTKATVFSDMICENEKGSFESLRRCCGIFAAALACGELAARALARGIAAATPSPILSVILSAAVRAVVIAAAFCAFHIRPDIRPMLRPAPADDAAVLTAAYFVLLAPVTVLNLFIAPLAGDADVSFTLLYLVRVLIVTPLLETLVYMLLPLGALRHQNGSSAVLFCAVCFALCHDAASMPSALVLGTVLCAACRSSAPLCLALHVLHNLLCVIWSLCVAHSCGGLFVWGAFIACALCMLFLARRRDELFSKLKVSPDDIKDMFFTLPFAALCVVVAARLGGII